MARGERLWAERDEASFYVLVLAGALTLTRHGHVIEGAVPGSMAGQPLMQTAASWVGRALLGMWPSALSGC